MYHILIVEDDPAISELLEMNFRLVGYAYKTASTAEEGERLYHMHEFDLLLLDVMLPKQSGFWLAKQLQPCETPIIFLTAKDQLADRLQGFDLGAIDYVIKPFEMLELLARIKAALAHIGKAPIKTSIQGITIFYDERRVEKNGQEIPLTPIEYQLLEMLVKNQNIALSRDRLLEQVWGYDFEGDTRTVDVHITKLRKKLGFEQVIRTVYKVGYRLEVPR